MANADRPNGFRPAKMLNGSPYNGLLRKVGVADGADIFIGDPLDIVAGLGGPAASGATVLGVALGFGREVPGTMGGVGPFDPSNLENRFYDDSASTHTEWVVYYAPAEAVQFEVQQASDLDLQVGDPADFVDGGGNTTSGVSGYELTTASNNDVLVTEQVEAPDNDPTLIHARYLVLFSSIENAQ